jgi:hypothetical protein
LWRRCLKNEGKCKRKGGQDGETRPESGHEKLLLSLNTGYRKKTRRNWEGIRRKS